MVRESSHSVFFEQPVEKMSASESQQFKVLHQLQSSDILPRLRANDRPTSLELGEMERLLRNGKSELARYAVEIGKLRAAAVSLENESKSLDGYLKTYGAFLSPVRRLPPEILQEIFILCCPVNTFYEEGVDAPALILGVVCSHWRRVALATPRIWSMIDVDPQWDIRTMETYMERSGQAPLTIQMTGTHPGYREDKQGYALAVLARHSHRWASLCLDLLPTTLLELNCIKNKLPILETLNVETDNLADLDLDVISNIFKDAPMLHTLITDGCLDGPGLDLSWTQMRNLEMNSSATQSFIHVMAQCTSLEEATVNHAMGSDVHAVTGSELASLTMMPNVDDPRRGLAALGSIISALTLPSLKSLHFLTLKECVAPGFPADQLQSLFARSSCTLTNLTLDRVPVTSAQTLDILRSQPSLENLTINELSVGAADIANGFISEPIVNRGLLRAMHTHVANTSSVPFLPNLTRFAFTVRDTCDIEAFASMVMSRWSPNGVISPDGKIACLKSVSLEFFDGAGLMPSIAHLQPLLYLRTAGLEVKLGDPKGYIERVLKEF